MNRDGIHVRRPDIGYEKPEANPGICTCQVQSQRMPYIGGFFVTPPDEFFESFDQL